MVKLTAWVFLLTLLYLFDPHCKGQAYSPTVLKAGQIDTRNVNTLAKGIYAQANAKSPREKAEAIWRFFLTDGRFVKSGFWYHIAGWAYEEPRGEVLDPVKLLNSYGFGLCYQIAPLLEAVFDAGGFEDARVWFLTGHTVAEVFYDGQYHYFDSDMMGYNTVGFGPLKMRRVASVHDIEQNGNIILGKLTAPNRVDPTAVDAPWYPADVRASAIGDLAALFTTTNDNWLYSFHRYPQGHSMNFVMRPGERMIRYFKPELKNLYYLPYTFNGLVWHEFPQAAPAFGIRTEAGPRSQKDSRTWATGRIEYRPQLSEAVTSFQPHGDSTFIFDMPCPYVIIDARYAATVNLPDSGGALTVESSVDGGHTWTKDSSVRGPLEGVWNAGASTILNSEHGKLTDVSGTYGYKVRLSVQGADPIRALRDVVLTTIFQLNPRTLPALAPGTNELTYRTAQQERTEIPVRADHLDRFASKVENAVYNGADGQGYVMNEGADPGEVTFALASPHGHDLASFEVGGRFLDVRNGLAPDKLTAEVRKIAPWSANDAVPCAQISWSTNPNGPFQNLWTHDPKLTWKDGHPISRTLNWPEVDKHVDRLPAGTKNVFVRYAFTGMAIDSFRLAVVCPSSRSSSKVKVTQLWRENGVERSNFRQMSAGTPKEKFTILLPKSASIENEALIIECLR